MTKKTLRIYLSRLKFISAGMVCGLPDLFNDKKLQKKTNKKLILTITHLLNQPQKLTRPLYQSDNIVDHVQSRRLHIVPAPIHFYNNTVILNSFRWSQTTHSQV